MHACLLCFCIFCRVIFLAWIFLALANPQLPKQKFFRFLRKFYRGGFFSVASRGKDWKDAVTLELQGGLRVSGTVWLLRIVHPYVPPKPVGFHGSLYRMYTLKLPQYTSINQSFRFSFVWNVVFKIPCSYTKARNLSSAYSSIRILSVWLWWMQVWLGLRRTIQKMLFKRLL